MMRNILSVILIAFCLYSCTSDSDSPKTGDIYGVVTEKSSAEPMRATGVELYTDDKLLLKTVTYDDGHYEFNELTPGEYTLKVVAEGYDDATYEVEVEKGRTARADMQLEKVYTGLTVSVLEVTLSRDKESALLEGRCFYTHDYIHEYSEANEVGFIYAQSIESLSKGNKITTTKDYGKFSATIKNLKKGTYYIQAYAKNRYGTELSEIVQLEIAGDPVVTTLAATNVTVTTATLNGKIDNPGDPVYTEKGFVYSISYPNPSVDDPKSATTKVSVSGTSKEFSVNIANLIGDATYNVRTYVVWGNEVIYGESLNFKATSEKDYYILEFSSLMVQKVDLSSGADWYTASDLCESSTMGGYTDWRLPTRGELAEIYNNQSISWMSTGVYWSGEPCYAFNMSTGKVNSWNCSNSFKVRAVRSIN